MVPFGMGVVCLCGLLKKKKNKNQKADLFDDKEEERYYKLFPSRRIQVDFVLTQLNGLGSERSFAFGITCPWGGGKTSFLNGVKDRIQKNGWSKNDFIQREHLAEDIAEECEKMYQKRDRFDITVEDVIFVDYNPWFANGSKHVVAHFLDALQKSLSPYDGELAGSIAKYRKLLLSLNPGVFNNVVDGTVNFFSVHKDIEDRFKRLEECIQRLNKKILVFMDDLDRLEANELVASLKIIRNTGSFKNVVFFVTYDKEYVLSQLASHFNFDKKDKKQGDRFLEKFFQLEVSLPKLYSSEVRKYVKDLINDNLSAVLDDHDLLKEDSVGSFFRFQNVVYNELEEELNNLPDMEETNKDRKEIMDILELIPTIDLMIEIQSPRYWKKIVNQISLSSELLKSGNVDLSQLFLMIAFKQKYPSESYQIFRELLSSNGDSFMSRNSIVSYKGEYAALGRNVNKRIYEIGNYDLKYIQYVGAFFVNKTYSSIGFYRNYLHYYNLSFPLTYINPDCFNRLLNNPNEVRIIKNSNDENKYLGFNKMLYENDLSQVNPYLLLIFDILINEEKLLLEIPPSGQLHVLNHKVKNVFRKSLFIERLDEDILFSVLKAIDYVEESAILGYLKIWIPYQRNLNISTKKLENVAIRYFRYRIKGLTISLLQFGVMFSSEDSYNNFTDELKSELNEFLSDNYENLLTFIKSVVLFKEKIGFIHNGFFELDVFAAAKDENFIDDYELKEQDIEKKDIIHTYDQLINTCQPTALGKLI
ncbi:MAG: KAP family NTPase [Prolixibacteraceae bacterium]|nr:KAP family NTPase [Prolixibacteraceae bacterium]